MPRRLRAGIITTAGFTAAVVLYVILTLPRSPLVLDDAAMGSHVAGAYHIHTTRSDGTGSPDEIAAAAARAGLRFIVLTDHGDATRTPDPPAYRHGVLVIDAVEINTREGHVVALGLDDAAPYPLAGLARDVIEDIRRLGGAAIVAHPDSPRSELAWRGNATPFDGIEWINVDSEWRDDQALTLLTRAAQSLLRPAPSVASLFARPVRSLQRWDAAARLRPVAGLAALDAHASIGWREQEEPRRAAALALPTYETMFRTLTQTVIVDGGLTGEPGVDATRVVSALRQGQSYSTVRAWAWPSAIEFGAIADGVALGMGARLTSDVGSVAFHARTPNAPGSRVVLLMNGQPIATGQGGASHSGAAAAGTYRVEAYLPASDVPWIVTNPITVTAPGGTPGPPPGSGSQARPGTSGAIDLDAGSSQWTIEHDALSTGTHRAEANGLRFDFRLGDGLARGQYAALVFGDESGAGVETVRFTARADRAMRISVQVRLPEGRGRAGIRWRRSIYVDETARRFELRLQDFEPADRPTTRRPIVTPIQSLLFVADTINTRPGSEGSVWLSDVSLGTSLFEN